jgi:hypothetical protein
MFPPPILDYRFLPLKPGDMVVEGTDAAVQSLNEVAPVVYGPAVPGQDVAVGGDFVEGFVPFGQTLHYALRCLLAHPGVALLGDPVTRRHGNARLQSTRTIVQAHP